MELEDLSAAQQEALAELAVELESGDADRHSRRDVLKAAGLTAAGGLLAGGAASEVVQPARADPQGVLGTQSDPWQEAYLGSLDLDELSPNAAEGVSQSVSAALSEGLAAVKTTAGGVKSADPTSSDFNSDDEALQALADYADNNGGGTIYRPPTRPDGANWTIEATVDCRSTGTNRISYLGPRAFEARDGVLKTTITDKSHMFHFGQTSSATGGKPVGIRARLSFRGTGDDVSLAKFSSTSGWHCHVPWAYNYTGDSITINSACFDWYISGFYDPANTAARGFVAADDYGTGKPGDGTIGRDAYILSDHSVGVVWDQGARIQVDGHLENANGQAEILSRGGGIVRFNGHINVTKNGAHGIETDSARLLVDGGEIVNCDGDGINSGDGNSDVAIRIADSCDIYANTGDDINIASAPVDKGVVPDPATFEGTVTYPSGTTTLYQRDVTQL